PCRAPVPPADRRVAQAYRRHALQRLGDEHAPGAEPEDAPGERHDPQRGGRFVDGDEAGGVERPEEEGPPAPGARLDGRGIEVVAVAVGAKAPEIEDAGPASSARRARRTQGGSSAGPWTSRRQGVPRTGLPPGAGPARPSAARLDSGRRVVLIRGLSC